MILILIGIFSGMGMAIGLGAMGLLVASVAWIWNKFCLEDLGYERIIPHKRVFKGEKVPLSIELSNRKPIPISRIDIDDDLDEDTSSESNDDLTDALNPDDLSLDLIIKEAVKESLDDWFSRNLKTIVEESVKQEISKLFKKRN